MKPLLTLIFIGLACTSSFSQENGAYTIFDSKGKKVKYSKMLKALDASQIILFGEYHDNPIAHWLQYEVTPTLLKTNKLVWTRLPVCGQITRQIINRWLI